MLNLCLLLSFFFFFSCLVIQSCPTLCDPMNCSTPGFPVHTNSRSLLKLMSITSVIPSSHLILCRPLLLPPSMFPSIRVFPNESVLRIRGPKYWSFGFSISPSNEHPGLISFRMDCLDLLAVQGTLKKFFPLSPAPLICWDPGMCQCLFSVLWLSQSRDFLRSANET